MSVTIRKRFWLFRPITLGGIAFLAFSAWFVFGSSGVWDSYQLRGKKMEQEAELRLLRERKKLLQDYLTALKKSDDLALERAARERGFVGPNDVIYSVQVEPQASN